VSEAEEPQPDLYDGDFQTVPRLRVVKGKPWRINPSRRQKWSAPDFAVQHALPIRQIGDPVLHTKAKRPARNRAELEALVIDMFTSMIAARGVGIAASQIGRPLRVVIADVDHAGIVAVDPVVTWTGEELVESTEGCLSVRGLYAYVARPSLVRVEAIDIAGEKFTAEGEGYGAQCLLHEVDHTHGLLYVNHLKSPRELRPVETSDGESEGSTPS
jgi:peptide deformylase